MQEHAQLHYLALEAEEIKAVWEWEGVGTWGGGHIFYASVFSQKLLSKATTH